jgi:N-acetyl-1-D-myo-inositol-2-amino-2-deoxy-alpha-D-glucopyranoside deacetylase
VTAIDLPLQRVLIIAPHPDDDVIANAGLMQKTRAAGGQIRVLFVTDGENNGWAQRFMERRIFLGAGDRRRWGDLRRHEAEESLIRLGIPQSSAVFLGFPDQKIAAQLISGETALQTRLAQEMDRFRPTLVVAPSRFDLHPDHVAISCFAHRAAAESAWRDALVVTYVIHGSAGSSRIQEEVHLSPCEQETKRAAIACHVSQLFLSGPRFLSYASETECFYPEETDLAVPSRAQLRAGWRRHVLAALRSTIRSFRGPQRSDR